MGQFKGALARLSQQAHVHPTCLRRLNNTDRRGFANGGRPSSGLRPNPLAQRTPSTAGAELQTSLPPVTAARPAATPAAAATKATTSVWPCRDGQLVRVLQSSTPDGGHTLQIIVEGLPDGQDADLLWGVYRSSPHAWQHPDSISIPGSKVHDSSGAMMSPMHPLSTTAQTISIEIPPGLAPVTFAFIVSLHPQTGAEPTGKKKRKFVVPLEGRHFSALLGAAPGLPSPLGPSIVHATAAASKGKKKKSNAAAATDTATINFAVRCRGGTALALVLLQAPPAAGGGDWTVVELALDPTLNRTGDTWHISIPNLRNFDKLCYGWRVDGDVSWESGFRIQPELVLVDPEAPGLVHLPMTPAPPLQLPSVELPDGTKVLVASAVDGKFNQKNAQGVSLPLHHPLEQLRVLEIDVRTFAQGPKVTHPGTFLGVVDRVDQIKAVGANAVVLAPCHATAKGAGASHRAAALSYLAPDPSLSTDPTNPAAAHAELREMVHALHAAGIEVIPSLDLTITADGVDAHPTAVSLRGLDHAAYFRPNGVVNCGHPAFQDVVRRAMRYWAVQFGVDGFCFVNAENMAQDAHGCVMDAPSLPESLCQDPILSGLKLIAAPSNESLLPRGGVRGFPHWGIWQQRNAAFTRDITALLAETSHAAIDAFSARLTGSANVFGPSWDEEMPGNLATARRPSFSFNAVEAAGGQSAIEVAAEAAGVAGAAVMASGGGPIPSATTIAKSLLLAALVAQGVPVISQQDVADVEMARFVGVVSRLRRKLSALLLPPRFDSPRDIAWHSASGAEPEWIGEHTVGEEGVPLPPSGHGSCYLAFSVRHLDGSAVYVGFNPHPLMVTAALPPAPPGHTWLRAVDTGLPAPQDAAITDFVEIEGTVYGVSGKAAIVLIAAVVDHVR